LIIYPNGNYFAAFGIECGDPSWVPYKDKLCIKLAFEGLFLNFFQAAGICSGLAEPYYDPSLLRLDSPEIQEFVTDYLYSQNGIVDDVWIGARFNQEKNQFTWLNGSELGYSNWAPGYPRDDEDNDRCVVIRPPGSIADLDADAKWVDISCSSHKIVACQREPVWSMEKVVDEIVKLKAEFADEIGKLKAEDVNLRQQVIQIGFIYVEYPFTGNPTELWPQLGWQDVSAQYSGHFFRVVGGGAGEWGVSQGGCAPRFTSASAGGSPNGGVNIPDNGCGSVKTGDWSSGIQHSTESTTFCNTGCEVRPVNMPVRVWKRIA